MKELTLEGFLDRYVRELSGFERINLAQMAIVADRSQPRIKEPVVIYAAMMRSPETVRRLFRGTSLLSDYERYFCNRGMLSETDYELLPEGYRKVYRSYLSVKNKNQNEMRIKALYRTKILEVRSNCTLTDYRICRELKINSGNFHSFMKQEKMDSLSLVKVRQVYELVKSQRV